MSTVRVYELAKELNVSNKEVLDFLKSKNIDLTSHMSTVEDAHAQMVRANFKKGNVSAASAGKQAEGENLSRYSALRTQATCLSADRKTGSREKLARNRKQIINARITVREIAEVQQAV